STAPPKPPPKIDCAGKARARSGPSDAERKCVRSHPIGPLLATKSGVFHVRAPALPAQRFLGGGSGMGAKPPSGLSSTLLVALPGGTLQYVQGARGYLGDHWGLLAKSPSPIPIWYARKSPKPRLRSPEATPR